MLLVCYGICGVQTALEARSKIGVKPTRKYVRKKSAHAGSEQPGEAMEGGQEQPPMNGLESAHSGSGLDGSSPGKCMGMHHSHGCHRWVMCCAHQASQ